MFCKQTSFARFLALAIAVAVAVSASPSRAEVPRDCAVADFAGTPVERLEGKRFSVEVHGTGPDVILIPGLSSPRAVWDETVQTFAGCYRLHSVQLRGFGDEAGLNAVGPALEPFMLELADYIDDEIVNKGRAAPAIVGHSMGGLSGLMIAARQPQFVGRLMVVDAVPFIGTIFGISSVDAIRPRAEQMKRMIAANYKADAPKPALKDCKNPAEAPATGNLSNHPRGLCLIQNWTAQSDPRVVGQVMHDVMVTDMRPELPKISALVTLLYAQDDRAMTETTAKAAFEPQYVGTPNFRPVVIKGSYHFIMLDQPEKFRAELHAFLGS
jgi:pimeloyl-ACP methyl ester carboxylesterase